MWSDSIAPERHQELVEQLRALAPPVERVTRRTVTFDEAEHLQSQPGFMWLNGTDAPWVVHSPLVTLDPQDFGVPAFDLLAAAREAWPNALLAGYLAYDLAAELEDLGPQPPDDIFLPQMHFGVYSEVQVFHVEHTHTPAVRAGALSSRPDRAGFEASVANIVASIHAGDIFQTNLCRRITAEFDANDAWPLFRRLCEINPARYAAFIRVDERRAVMSISPELFLKVEDGVVQSCPIKGTRPLGDTMVAELLSSEKDRAELAMIVDVTRNDLGRVCETGSVRVVEHAELMTLPTVHHLYSTVTGKLAASNIDALRAAFPPASISGAPKIQAIRVAQREERQRRGPAMGAIGWIEGDAMEFSVAIRTAFTNGERVFYYAGCGITADSDPEQEFLESGHKAAAFERAIVS
jgi:anthranilate/para-aminobenzoate synthase component I